MRSLIIVFILISINGFAQQSEKRGTIKVKKKTVEQSSDTIHVVRPDFDSLNGNFLRAVQRPKYPEGVILK